MEHKMQSHQLMILHISTLVIYTGNLLLLG